VVGRISLRVDPEVKECVVFYAAGALGYWPAGAALNGGHPGSAFKAPEGERTGEPVVGEGSLGTFLRCAQGK